MDQESRVSHLRRPALFIHSATLRVAEPGTDDPRDRSGDRYPDHRRHCPCRWCRMTTQIQSVSAPDVRDGACQHALLAISGLILSFLCHLPFPLFHLFLGYHSSSSLGTAHTHLNLLLHLHTPLADITSIFDNAPLTLTLTLTPTIRELNLPSAFFLIPIPLPSTTDNPHQQITCPNK